MKKMSIVFLLVYGFSFFSLANESELTQGYDCNSLNDHLENQLASTPEWKIRVSVSNWEEYKGGMPDIEAAVPNFVYLLCEEERNSARLVKDIVFDVLDQAAYEAQIVSN
ncbi:hypothetical protein Shal_3383 [Shewanella halifaxensis HAW-EB4]|uniref:Uncharacterized protein n=1 Tax=Shewanella halifaxensis (strain HAW-EB4) TaxID=458817 RepID=B0TSH5_SHEHH|nr:hypothetical protein [Shewanella halifaxensis]ABZ77929.1 hypothetical protein Shal_3383 [Shewanella halifaxensis HAW-EB4]